MDILMVALKNKFGPFREFGGSKSKSRSDDKSRDNEDKENDSKRSTERETKL
jgi:hypothetical protein